MNKECIVQFKLWKDETLFEAEIDEIIFEMTLSYSPHFFIGQKIHLSNSIMRGFEEKWRNDLEHHEDYEVMGISQSFESRYFHNKKDLHFVIVAVKGAR